MRIKKWMTLLVAFAMAFTVFGFGFGADYASAAVTKPTKITLTKNYTTIDIKGKATVKVKSVYPAKASKSVYWKSSNTKVATVSSTGVVTGKKTGSVTITATSKSNSKVKASVKIYVKQLAPTVSLPSTVYLYTGVPKKIKATVPTNRYNAGVVYRTSSTLGYVTPASKATTGYVTLKNKTPKYQKAYFILTAYSRENPKIKDTCKVYVCKSMAGLTFAKTDVELKNGASYTQAAKITPSTPKSYAKTCVYTTSNSKVVKIVNSTTGAVKAVGLGTATITATAKYGYPVKATYKISVYDELKAENGVYTIDENKYGKYEISASKDGIPGKIVLKNADIKNIIGEGNVGFDWQDAISVQDNFGAANFSYTSGNDYIFSKSGNKVTIKFADSLIRTSWYYTDKSFKLAENGTDYTITLFSEDGGDSIQLVKKGNTITTEKANKKLTMTRNGRDVKVAVTTGGRTLEAVFHIVTSGSKYTVTIPEADIAKYGVTVKAYK